MRRKIVKGSIVKIRENHKCYGCGREFKKGTDMFSATCVLNDILCRKYFCEGCYHEISTKGLDLSDFYYGELITKAVTYEKNKR